MSLFTVCVFFSDKLTLFLFQKKSMSAKPKEKQSKTVSIITIPKDKQEPYLRRFWGSAENIFVGTELTQVKSGGAKEARVIFITTAAIYVFKNKSFSGVELAHHFTVIDLTKVAYIEPDTLVVAFGTKEIVFRTENRPGDALKIGTLLLMQHACNFYQVPNATKLRVESSPQGALTYVKCPVRPKNALQTRLVTISHYYKKPFPQSNIKQYNEWDQTHPGTFVIDDKFNTKDAAEAIAHAIAWDCDIKTLILRKFAAPQIGKVLEKFFEESFTIQRICLEGYTDEQTESIKLQAREETVINSILFKDCHPTLVIKIVRGLSKFDGRLRTVQITNCPLKKEDWSEVFAAISKFPCFMKFSSLIIEDLKLSTFPVNLLCQSLSKSRTFNCLTINRCGDDLAGFLSNIFDDGKQISHIQLEHCKLLSAIKAKNVPNFSFISFSYSQVSKNFFKSFAELTMTRPTARPFVLDMSVLVDKNYESLFGALEGVQIVPILCEFLFNGNILSPTDVPSFTNFLSSQKQSLQFLSLINCICNVTNVILPVLLQMCKEAALTGFDITSDKTGKGKEDYIQFLKELEKVKTLKSMTLGNVAIGDEGLDLILNVLKNNSNLEELSLDGVNISSQDKFCSFFDQVIACDSIKFLGNPRKEMTKLGITKDKLTPKTKETLLGLKKKKLPLTQLQRLALYEKIEYDDNSSVLEEGEMRRAKQNPLDELEAVQRSICNAICEIEPSEWSPEETARLIMSNITTASSSISKEQDGSHKKVGSIFAKL